MILSRLDLPEPLSPSTPILAPGKKESEMSLRITRLGGTSLPTRFMVYTYCAIGVATRIKREWRLSQVLPRPRHAQDRGRQRNASLGAAELRRRARLFVRRGRCRLRRCGRRLGGATLPRLCGRLRIARCRGSFLVGHYFVPALLDRVV